VSRKNVDEVIDRFSKAVRVFIEREEIREKIEKKIEKYEKWYKEVFNSG
jgi:ribosome-associated translation inhibitor RaiA